MTDGFDIQRWEQIKRAAQEGGLCVETRGELFQVLRGSATCKTPVRLTTLANLSELYGYVYGYLDAAKKSNIDKVANIQPGDYLDQVQKLAEGLGMSLQTDSCGYTVHNVWSRTYDMPDTLLAFLEGCAAWQTDAKLNGIYKPDAKYVAAITDNVNPDQSITFTGDSEAAVRKQVCKWVHAHWGDLCAFLEIPIDECGVIDEEEAINLYFMLVRLPTCVRQDEYSGIIKLNKTEDEEDVD